MPDEIEARISIAVESAKAEQGISAVKQSVGELTRARWKMLDAMKAERTLARKLDAGYPITAEEMARASAATRRLREEYEALKASRRSAASPAQNLSAVSAAAKTAVTGINAAGKATQKLTLRMIAAKSAARAFGVSIGQGLSTPMMQLGIIAAGVQSGIKLVTWAFEAYDKSLERESDLQRENSKSFAEAAERMKERHKMQTDALSVMERYNEEETHSAKSTFEFRQALSALGNSFGRLGGEIDGATGKIKNFYEVQGKLRREQIVEEQKQIKASLRQLAADQRAAEDMRDNSGVSFWGLTDLAGFRIGGGEAAKEAGERINRIGEERMELMKRLAVLKRLNPEEEARAKQLDAQAKAQVKAQAKATTDLDRQKRMLSAAESTALQAAQRIAAEQFKYRSTLMRGVESGSMEALRLQSRVMINTDTSPAQKAASGIRVLVDQGKVLDQRLQTLSGQVSQLVTNTRNTAGALTGGRQY